MALRTCSVSYEDLHGIIHSVDVSAESLYEAAALALRVFRQAELLDYQPGLATRLSVAVRHPVATHVLTVGRLRDWLNGMARSPAEKAAKERIRVAVPWLE